MRKLLPLIGVAALAWACGRQPSSTRPLYFDSLLQAQVNAYRVSPSGIEKYAQVDEKTDTTRLAFDQQTLKREWDMFRPLDAFQKPAFADAYTLTVEKDPHSNLTVKRYRARKDVPVPELAFYYLNTPDQLKAIKATFEELNVFYATQRHLQLTFAERDGLPVITHYSVAGYQKMVLADSVTFSIAGRIVWQ